MIYAMSDLHGRHDLFLKMLEKINFSDDDTLYILGDVLDRGNDGFEIVFDISGKDNVIAIMGNHDLTALLILSRLDTAVNADERDEMRQLIAAWLADGGEPTYKAFRELSALERRLALGLIGGYRKYAEVSVGGRDFVLCHGGIENYSPERPLYDYDFNDFAFCRTDYSRPLIDGRILVTGHTPTAAIEGAEEGKIFKSNGHIAIDCGAVFGFGLGCICLDTLEEFYVK